MLRRCLYVLHPIWMVGGWFVHYGVSVLRCAIFGDFYRIPNLELWIFPFLSLASLAYICFATSWSILFLRRPEPVPYIALNCDCLSLFLRQLARGGTLRCYFIFHLVIFCLSLFPSLLVLEPVYISFTLPLGSISWIYDNTYVL